MRNEIKIRFQRGTPEEEILVGKLQVEQTRVVGMSKIANSLRMFKLLSVVLIFPAVLTFKNRDG